MSSKQWQSERFCDPGVFLRDAQRLEIYSLDPMIGENPAADAETFCDWLSLGHCEVTDRGQIARIHAQIFGDIHDGPEQIMVLCFWPRHGIRAFDDKGESQDYLICYQCSTLQTLAPLDERSSIHLKSSNSKQELDQILQDAGVAQVQADEQ